MCGKKTQGLSTLVLPFVLDAGIRDRGRNVFGELENPAQQDRHIIKGGAGTLFDGRITR